MKRGLEIRLYPSKEQRVFIDRIFGCSRFVYNHVLALKKELWEDYKLSFNPNLKSFKEEWKFFTKVPSQALANSYMDCMTAFNNWFNSLKGKSKVKQSFPKFHKKGQKDSFRIAATKTSKGYDLRIEDFEYIKVPKLGLIKFRNYNNIDWSKIHIYNITIKKTTTNKYFGSLCVELSEKEYIKPKYESCGFDLGLKDFCIFDSGMNTPNTESGNKTLLGWAEYLFSDWIARTSYSGVYECKSIIGDQNVFHASPYNSKKIKMDKTDDDTINEVITIWTNYYYANRQQILEFMKL